ncbi:MAG: OsmC family protein [Leadbetterella sp.]
MATSSVHYLGDLRTEGTHLASQKTFITDAPVDNNGKGEAFSPTDLAATSLANCAITIMGISAQKEGIDFKGTEISITKIMSTESPRRIAGIDLVFTMQATPSLDADQKARYERLAYSCPVALSLHPDIKQNFTFVW